MSIKKVKYFYFTSKDISRVSSSLTSVFLSSKTLVSRFIELYASIVKSSNLNKVLSFSSCFNVFFNSYSLLLIIIDILSPLIVDDLSITKYKVFTYKLSNSYSSSEKATVPS